MVKLIHSKDNVITHTLLAGELEEDEHLIQVMKLCLQERRGGIEDNVKQKMCLQLNKLHQTIILESYF